MVEHRGAESAAVDVTWIVGEVNTLMEQVLESSGVCGPRFGQGDNSFSLAQSVFACWGIIHI